MPLAGVRLGAAVALLTADVADETTLLSVVDEMELEEAGEVLVEEGLL